MPSPRLDDRVEPGRGRAGEDVDLDAGGGQAAGQLEHVDVHAAGIAGARLVQRRRVHADHRHPAYGVGLGEPHGVLLPARTSTGPNRIATAGRRPVIPAAPTESVREWSRGARAGDAAYQAQARDEPDDGAERRRRPAAASLSRVACTMRTPPTPASAARGRRRRGARARRCVTSSSPRPNRATVSRTRSAPQQRRLAAAAVVEEEAHHPGQPAGQTGRAEPFCGGRTGSRRRRHGVPSGPSSVPAGRPGRGSPGEAESVRHEAVVPPS